MSTLTNSTHVSNFNIKTFNGVIMTVEELLQNYQRTLNRNDELCAFIEAIRVECNYLVEISPHATQALRDLIPPTSDIKLTSIGNNNNNNNNLVSSSNTIKASKVQSKGDNVLEGIVVKSNLNNNNNNNNNGEDKTKSRFLRFVEEAKRDYKEECGVLKLKLLSLESAEKLLSQARRRIQEEEKRCANFISKFNTCREELAKSRSQCTFLLTALNENSIITTNNNNSTEDREKVEEYIEHILAGDNSEINNNNNKENSKFPKESSPTVETSSLSLLSSEKVNINKYIRSLTARALNAEISLEESQVKVNKLENNVKLLSYDNEQLQSKIIILDKECETLKRHISMLEGQLQRVLSLMHENPITCFVDDKKIENNNNNNNMMILKNVKKTPEYIAMEQRLSQLQDENRSMQNTLLQFQRQINDSELRAEEIGASIEEEKNKFKEEKTKLCNAVHEKQIIIQQIQHEFQQARLQWEQLEKVHQTVIQNMLKRLLKDKCMQFISTCNNNNNNKELLVNAKSETAIIKEGKKEELTKVEEKNAKLFNKESPVEVIIAQENQKEKEISLVNNSTNNNNNNNNNSNEVKELLSLLETQESKYRSSLKRWQQMNQELRIALATSQEEIERKKKYIKELEQKQALNLRGGKKNSDDNNNNNNNSNISSNLQKDEEKEKLLNLITTLQEGKSLLNSRLEEYKKRCETLEREIAHNAETMNHLIKSGAITPAISHIRAGNSNNNNNNNSSLQMNQLRALQKMLHDTLEENMNLKAKVKELGA